MSHDYLDFEAKWKLKQLAEGAQSSLTAEEMEALRNQRNLRPFALAAEYRVHRLEGANDALGSVNKMKTRSDMVKVFLFNQKGELLLHRTGSGAPNAGMWGSSSAGEVFSGESFDHAADRKVQADLGVHVRLTLVGKTSIATERAPTYVALYKATHEWAKRISAFSEELILQLFRNVEGESGGLTKDEAAIGAKFLIHRKGCLIKLIAGATSLPNVRDW